LVARVNRAEAMPEIYEAALDAMSRCIDTQRAAILLCDADGIMRFAASRRLSRAYQIAVEGHSPWQASDPDPQAVSIDDIGQVPSLAPTVQAALEAEGKIGALWHAAQQQVPRNLEVHASNPSPSFRFTFERWIRIVVQKPVLGRSTQCAEQKQQRSTE